MCDGRCKENKYLHEVDVKQENLLAVVIRVVVNNVCYGGEI